MIKKKQVFKVLKSFLNNDYYLEDFLDEGTMEEMLAAFLIHELIWLADNDRLLLTPYGEESLFYYSLDVEPNKKHSKV